MTKTLPFAVVGDVHGRLDTLDFAVSRALKLGLTNIIQVGDYWCYSSTRDRAKVDRILDRHARTYGMKPGDVHLWFCDGNHENFDNLNPDADAPVELSDNMTYMPRGTTTVIGGVTVGFLGGAESLDKDRRVEGISWWPAENITYTQAHRALSMGPIDVLITHDTTPEVYSSLKGLSHPAYSKSEAGHAEREAIQAVVSKLQPRWLVHGHHHTWAVHQQGNTRVVSLSADGEAGTVASLEELHGHPYDVVPSEGRFRDTDLNTTPFACKSGRQAGR